MADIRGLLAKYKKIEEERFFGETFENNQYALALNEPADIVLDIGALAGEFSAYIYDKAKVIYAVEPYVRHYKELVDNIAEFGLSKIKPYHLAIAGQNGQANLAVQSRGGHRLSEDANKNTQKVIGKTLAQFMKDENIEHVNRLKIDAEDAETQIFRAPDINEAIDKIDYIIGEHLGPIENELISYGFTKTAGIPNSVFKREEHEVKTT